MSITRRDFLQGAAITVAGASLAPELVAADKLLKDKYPPSKTGLRGNHPGSFEVAHQMGWQRQTFPRPSRQTDNTYDLVIVGGGLSGLAAAWYYREQFGESGSILIIDNHDDFGGHAKRNQFEDTQTIGYGGSQSIDSPRGSYSKQALRIIEDLGIKLDVFDTAYHKDWHSSRGLSNALVIEAGDKFENTSVVPDPFNVWGGNPLSGEALHQALAGTELTDDEVKQLDQFLDVIFFNPRPLYDGLGVADTIKRAKKQSFKDYLLSDLKMTPRLAELVSPLPKGLWGMSGDLLSAYDTLTEMADYVPLNLAAEYKSDDEPYIYHFPDGNASIARMMVRRLIPGVAPGDDMLDINTAHFDYNKLDLPSNTTRIRLNSTVTDVRHNNDTVSVCYRQFDKDYRVVGKKVVMACYMHVLPYLCSEMPKEQVNAMAKLEKVPLVVGNVSLKNWQFIQDSGISGGYFPMRDFIETRVDFPVSLGDVKFAQSPTDPVVINFWGVTCPNGPGDDPVAQLIAGKHRIYRKSFGDFEKEMIDQMTLLWGEFGFDPDKHISEITVNRWPHGYAYEHITRFDTGDATHVAARKGWGNLAIANSDSEAKAYVNGAFDAAYRAISELYS